MSSCLSQAYSHPSPSPAGSRTVTVTLANTTPYTTGAPGRDWTHVRHTQEDTHTNTDTHTMEWGEGRGSQSLTQGEGLVGVLAHAGSISCSPSASNLTCNPAGPLSLKLNVKQCQMLWQRGKIPLFQLCRQCPLNARDPARCSL